MPLRPSLLPLENQRLGELLPLAIHDDAQGAAVVLMQLIGAIGELGEGGAEVLTSVVVDDLQAGRGGRGDLGIGDEPLARVALGTEIAGQLTEEFLVGHGDRRAVEVDGEPHLVFVVDECALERGAVGRLFRLKGCCGGSLVRCYGYVRLLSRDAAKRSREKKE